MGVRDLLDGLASAGLSVTAHGDSLVIRPSSKLTEDMRAALRDAKPELLAVLPGGVGHDRFAVRRDRLLRWGWREAEAEAMALRLARRDCDADDRVACADCSHCRLGCCAAHRRAGLSSSDVGRDLAGLLQRCPAFASATATPGAAR